MKISTKGRYGLRTLIDLATHDEEAPISLAVVANRQGISINYLEQVIAILKRAKLVKSIKGASGGYKLACDPAAISLKQIITVLEGEITIIEYEETLEAESPLQKCVRENIWEAIDLRVDSVLEGLTLGDMMIEYHALKQGELSYFYSFEI
ncbi:MAG: RrF2 family transcriptional regulator [Cellulosilyticaceae bacterium]